MVAAVERRRLVLLVPHADGRRVVVDGARLPSAIVTLADEETTIGAAARVLATIGLGGPVLGCLVDQVEESLLGVEPRSALVEVAAPPSGWLPPGNWCWHPAERAEVPTTPALRRAAGDRLAELGDTRPVPAERAAWARPGWHERAYAWIDRSLAAVGRAAPDAVAPFRQWGISAVLRVDAADGRSWFKASCPLFRHEAAITARLAEIVPSAMCEVLAADRAAGWLLLADIGTGARAADPDDAAPAVEHLIRLQLATRQDRAALIATGCPHRPLAGLTTELEDALASGVARTRLDLTAPRAAALLDAVDSAARTLDEVGLPETLAHGDFHPGNVAITGDGPIVFDWSDATITNPIVDVATWASWFDGDERREAALWTTFTEAWERWYAVDADRIDRGAADIVAGAFHTVSYVRILEALEPAARVEHADGLDHFLALLTRSA